MSVQRNINGLILSGGKSSRMGMNKGQVVFHSRPQQEFLFDLLGDFCDLTYISCKTGNDISPNLNPLPDQFDLNTPLNGILTAFEKNNNVAWLTIPVDMPLIDKASINFLLTNRDKSKLATCFYDSDGNDPEPLFCLWESSAYPALQTFYKSGGISPRKFLQTHDVKLLRSPAPIHLNINTPEELGEFLKNYRQQS
ncbi:MAG TPA: molybdenum cofactor guanylyltransferase [Ohtaekwangia sp.]|nr:molybdenum cofactor guanylyltransferase [Ohtaekwangia sp.]